MQRKTLFAIALALVSCAVAFSQNSNNGNAYGNQKETAFVESHLDKMKQDITLAAEQEKEIKKLLGKLYKDRVQAEMKAEKNQKLKGKKLSYETYAAARDLILTEEQRTQLQQKAEERKEAGLRLIKSLSNNSQNP
jgi:Spy/CpxP family protein refolding chaperone